MNEEAILKKLEEHDKKLEAILKSAERTRKIFTWTLIISLALVVVPLLGLWFVIPKFLSTLSPASLGL